MILFQVGCPTRLLALITITLKLVRILLWLQHTKVVGGSLMRRYKRFLADVQIQADCDHSGDEASQVVFVPNTGSMAGLLERYKSSSFSYHFRSCTDTS